MRGAIRGSISLGAIALVLTLLATGLTLQRGGDDQDAGTNTAVIAVPRLENDFYDWYARHEQVKGLARQRTVDLIFVGDSIMHMFGGEPRSSIVRGADVWREFFGHRKALNLGFGWDRTQNVLWRLAHGELADCRPKVAVVLIGTNNLVATRRARSNSPEEIAAGVAAVCNAIRAEVPECRILLIGLMPRRTQEYVAAIEATNKLLSRMADGTHMVFLDPEAAFAARNGTARPDLMHDDVHPNVRGYRVLAESMEPVLSVWLSP